MKIFVCHPFSSIPVQNQRSVRQICRHLALQGHLPLAPQIYFPEFVVEATEREVALRLCLQLIAVADAVWVYGQPSEGMRLEVAEAERLGIPVVQKEMS